jgi:hypothetical protein
MMEIPGVNRLLRSSTEALRDAAALALLGTAMAVAVLRLLASPEAAKPPRRRR